MNTGWPLIIALVGVGLSWGGSAVISVRVTRRADRDAAVSPPQGGTADDQP